MAEDHRAPEAGQLSRAWTRGRRESPKSERRKESVAGQRRRGVLGRVSAGAAVRILDFANYKLIKAYQ